jgi:Fe-S cluster assembly iron-binding protein IscA
MLMLTDPAVAAVRTLTHQPNAPEGTGLRIATDPAHGALTLTVTPGPWSGDAVIDTEGARLFLDPEAATILENKALDVATRSDGQMEFRVGEQPA